MVSVLYWEHRTSPSQSQLEHFMKLSLVRVRKLEVELCYLQHKKNK